MPPRKRQTQLHGVTVTQQELQNNWYTPVAGRVKIAEQADPSLIRRKGAGYHVVSVSIMPVGDRWAYHCMVEFPVGSGVIKPGTDFIDLKDPSGIAKAETSAIGRALGLHGIDIEESIASADEISRVTHETHHETREADDEPSALEERLRTPRPALPTRSGPASTPPAQPTPANITQLDQQVASAANQRDLADKLRTAGINGKAAASTFLLETVEREINILALAGGTSDITVAEVRQVIAALARHNAARAEAEDGAVPEGAL